MMVIIPVNVLLTTPLALFYLYKTLQELRSMLKIMGRVSDQTKREACESMLIGETAQAENIQHIMSQNLISAFFIYVVMLSLIFIGVGLFTAVVMFADMHNNDFLHLNQWLFYGIMRLSYLHERFYNTMLSVAMANRII